MFLLKNPGPREISPLRGTIITSSPGAFRLRPDGVADVNCLLLLYREAEISPDGPRKATKQQAIITSTNGIDSMTMASLETPFLELGVCILPSLV